MSRGDEAINEQQRFFEQLLETNYDREKTQMTKRITLDRFYAIERDRKTEDMYNENASTMRNQYQVWLVDLILRRI